MQRCADQAGIGGEFGQNHLCLPVAVEPAGLRKGAFARLEEKRAGNGNSASQHHQLRVKHICKPGKRPAGNRSTLGDDLRAIAASWGAGASKSCIDVKCPPEAAALFTIPAAPLMSSIVKEVPFSMSETGLMPNAMPRPCAPE